MLHLLTEIRDSVQAVGRRYEPQDDEFNLRPISETTDFDELESSLSDEETAKRVVRD